jgi:hypothetical protein
VNNEPDLAVEPNAPLAEQDLNEYEIEFSKVESTLRALADETDPAMAVSWISKT